MKEGDKSHYAEEHARFSLWCATPLGRQLLDVEQAASRALSDGVFGHHIVQLGMPAGRDFMSGSRFPRHVSLLLSAAPRPAPVSAPDSALHCHPERLPLASDSTDLMLLPHCLEFSAHPHQILREVARVVIADGHVILVGFNPFSLWGLARIALRWQGGMPWRGCYLSARRIRDWLSLLNFDILATRYVCYCLPIQNQRVCRRTAMLERIGRQCWPPCAAVYIILAKKRVLPLTPIRPSWRRRDIAAGAMGQPCGRQPARRL